MSCRGDCQQGRKPCKFGCKWEDNIPFETVLCLVFWVVAVTAVLVVTAVCMPGWPR